MKLQITLSLAVLAVAAAEPQNYRTTPVPILKQINRHNDDGSYSYGYEGADGTFKIETKYPTGEVFGKYGYVDDQGKVREIEYGATKRGFEPSGTGINVPPPTVSNTVQDNSLDYDDGQYREDPATYYNKRPSSSSRQGFSTKFTYNTQTTTEAPPQYYNPPQQQQYYNPPRQQQYYNPPPQQQYYNPPQQQQYYNPPRNDPNQFSGHPATNFDIKTGSYSLTYSG